MKCEVDWDLLSQIFKCWSYPSFAWAESGSGGEVGEPRGLWGSGKSCPTLRRGDLAKLFTKAYPELLINGLGQKPKNVLTFI